MNLLSNSPDLSVTIRHSRNYGRTGYVYSDRVHTTPFSNENGTVLLRFQNDSRPH